MANSGRAISLKEKHSLPIQWFPTTYLAALCLSVAFLCGPGESVVEGRGHDFTVASVPFILRGVATKGSYSVG